MVLVLCIYVQAYYHWVLVLKDDDVSVVLTGKLPSTSSPITIRPPVNQHRCYHSGESAISACDCINIPMIDDVIIMVCFINLSIFWYVHAKYHKFAVCHLLILSLQCLLYVYMQVGSCPLHIPLFIQVLVCSPLSWQPLLQTQMAPEPVVSPVHTTMPLAGLDNSLHNAIVYIQIQIMTLTKRCT